MAGAINNSELEGKRPHQSTSFDEAFGNCIEKEDALSAHAHPIKVCGNDGCMRDECFLCFSDAEEKSLLRCAWCDKIRCNNCILSDIRSLSDGFRAFDNMLTSGGSRPVGKAEAEAAVRNSLYSRPDVFWRCDICEERCCSDCLPRIDIMSLVEKRMNKEALIKCERCHFATKPCTNPTCPNEEGVPTKRCGDCRRARYCSKECQIAAYLDHQKQCKKIQEKRAERKINKTER